MSRVPPLLQQRGHVMGAAQADREVDSLTAAKVLAQGSAAASYMPYSTTVLTV